MAALAISGGCGGARDAQLAAVQPSSRNDRFAEARSLFREICAGCHTLADAGAHGKRFDLDKDSPLALFLPTEAKRRQLVRFAILNGEDGMPAWRGVLSQREARQLIDYVVAVVRDEDVRSKP
ncbi:MAG: cytochrome c [Bradyrhizobium sp.]